MILLSILICQVLWQGRMTGPEGDLLRKGDMCIHDPESVLGPTGFHRKVILIQDVVKTGNASGPRHSGEALWGNSGSAFESEDPSTKNSKMVAGTGIWTHRGIRRAPGRNSQTKQALRARIQQTPAPTKQLCREEKELGMFTLPALGIICRWWVRNAKVYFLIIRAVEVLSD